jgi:hypothetical protein
MNENAGIWGKEEEGKKISNGLLISFTCDTTPSHANMLANLNACDCSKAAVSSARSAESWLGPLNLMLGSSVGLLFSCARSRCSKQEHIAVPVSGLQCEEKVHVRRIKVKLTV